MAGGALFLASHAECPACGRRQSLAPDLYQCGCAARENLQVRYDPGERTRAAVLDSTAGGAQSLWRYGPLLPVPAQYGTRLQVGWTPLLDLGRARGAHLYLKDETRLPSGSLKDRASEVVIAVAVAHGIRNVMVASTGNAAASLACLGASAGIAVTVLVPADAPDAKLAQILAHGANVYRVDGTYDHAYELARKLAAEHGVLNRSTGLNPFTREGKKTCALEIAEQMGWRAPDWVIVPTGDGNIISAVHKGFAELKAMGLIARMPRLAAAQCFASAAITRAFDPAAAPAADEAPARTIADSIWVGEPRDATLALEALRDTGGAAIAVSDAEIVQAVRDLASGFGVFLEPSSAAGFAAFGRLVEAEVIEDGERVVLLGTGTGLKDLRPVLDADALAAVRVIAPGAWEDVRIG